MKTKTHLVNASPCFHPDFRLSAESGASRTEAKTTIDSDDSQISDISKPSPGDSTLARSRTSSSAFFAAPSIVPQGTSIRINGSTRMIQINQALKKSFQRRFPGTAIIANADGSETGIELLRTGEIDLAAILRPLSTEEKAQGLAAVTVDELISNLDENSVHEMFYYAYREPASVEVEIFLGFALSTQGQQAIVNR